MVSYLVRRVVYMLLLLVVLSFVSFVLIELPPGDALSTMIQQMRTSGRSVSAEDIRYLEELYGLNRPFVLRYGKWFFNLIQGDMGQSLIHGMPVNRLISERYWLTAAISFASLLFVFAVAVPIGIYSATHQYAPSDYVFTVPPSSAVPVAHADQPNSSATHALHHSNLLRSMHDSFV